MLSGVLSYYQAQLNDVMMYSDLQPKVFQCMREIGNAILFCRLLEQSLVSLDPFPFQINFCEFELMIDKVFVAQK